MPGIFLPVGAKADDRSFKQIGDQAERFFRKVGKDASTGFTKEFAEAVNSSSPQIQKSFDKIADAVGRVRAEQAKLDDLQTRGAGSAQLISQSERLEKARRSEAQAVRAAQTAYTELNVTAGALQQTLQGFVSGSLSARVPWLNAGQIDSAASALGGISPKALGAATGVAAIGAAAVVAGKQLFDLGMMWDDISDGIVARTGKVGDELQSITDIVKDVGTSTALPLKDIGAIAGQVSASMHLSGDELRAMTDEIASLQQVTGQGVDIRSLGQAFRVSGVGPEQYSDALNTLMRVSQATQIPLNELISTMQQTSKVTSEVGLSFDQTLGFISAFEAAGVDTAKAAPALSIALKNLAKDGKAPSEGLQETITAIRELHDAGQETAAINLAQSTFGRGFADLLAPIEDGRLDVESLNKAVQDTGPSINDLKRATEDGAEGWQKMKNAAQSALSPIADWIFSNVNQPLLLITDNIDKLEHSSTAPITPDSPLGRMMLPAGGAPGTGHPLGTGVGSGFGPVSTAPPSGPSWGPPAGGLFANPSAAASSAAAKTPGAPAVPYDTSLPPGFANLPQTSEIVGAENSWMDARHALAEKQARVSQLEKDSTATQDDLIKARNDVINAQQAQNQTELRLNDARQSLYDKANKQLNGYADQMGEIGAKLDQDLGISKGLPGLADNLVRFLGNLIAAPALAQLNAISNAPGQAQGGFGLMGMLGAQGAFGPQYTAEGQAAASASSSGGASPSAMGPAAIGGGMYPGDAALLANVPAGSYSKPGSGAWDLTKGLGDCSSAVEDLVNIMDGGQTGGRSMSTGNEADWLTQHGFVPGMGGPGDFRVGFNSHHTQATLPGGTPFNWGSDAAAARGGVGGTGADDPAFTSHFYRPGGGATGIDAAGMPVLPTTTGVPSSSTAGFPVPLPVTIVGGLGSGGAVPVAGGAPGAAPGGAPGGAAPGGVDPYAPVPAPAPAPGGGGGWGLSPLPTSGGAGQSPLLSAPGPGIGASVGAGGPGASRTQIGAVATPASGSGQGGIGIAPGGSIDSALGLAAGAADLIAPGAGQAAQAGVKLAGRAIQFAGQSAAIGVQGLMDTVLPTGGSDLANHSWFTKILGGLAGAAPALPNMAGKSAAASGKEGQGQQQGGPAPGGDTHINVTNNRATEDGTGRDIAWHQQQQQLPAGRP